MRTIAAPLVAPGVRTDEDVVGALLDRVATSKAGEDPLGRQQPDIGTLGDPLLRDLVPEIQESTLAVGPICDARTVNVDGHMALSLQTTMSTGRSLADLRAMADPRQWPRIPDMSRFFRRMDMVQPPVPPPTALLPPQRGWTARLREVVDFSFGVSPSNSSQMVTDLDFTYVDTERAVYCTYDLGESQDDKIVVDRGYVMIEEVEGASPYRQVTTLKQVRFRRRPQPGDVCEFWSLATAAAAPPSLSAVADASSRLPRAGATAAGDPAAETTQQWELLLDDVRDCWRDSLTRMFDRTRDNVTLAREGRYNLDAWLDDVNWFWSRVSEETSNIVGRVQERSQE